MPLLLTPDERAILDLIAKNERMTYARRARIVLGAADGLDREAIAISTGLTARTVRRWLRAFAQERLAIFPSDVLPAPTARHQDVHPDAPAITIAELCRRHHVNLAHGRHVGRIAAELFSLTQPIHLLDERYRDLTYTAGLLHNVAYAAGKAGHHTRGRDILLSTPLIGLSEEDRIIAALSIRFHRKRWKGKRLRKEAAYQDLSRAAKHTARTISALVRIADGFDYSHTQSTVIGQAVVAPAMLTLALIGPYVEMDAPRADKKADMWRAVYGIPITIHAFENSAALEEALSPVEPEATEPPSQRPAELLGIYPTDHMAEAGRQVLAFHARRMMANEEDTRLGDDPEALHDMRVTTRRMRAALRVFGSYYEKDARIELIEGLRRAGSMLGEVRDLDVMRLNLEAYQAATTDQVLDQFMVRWRKKHSRARTKLTAYLEGEEYQAFTDKLGTFISTPGLAMRTFDEDKPTPVDVRHAAPRIIYRRYARLRAFNSDPVPLPEAPIETLHALRIEGKRLRYTLEFFREVLGPEVEVVIDALIEVQDHIGMLNDAVVARTFTKKVIKKAKKRRKEKPNFPSPELSTEEAYLAALEEFIGEQRRTLPPVWRRVTSPAVRRALALAVSPL